MFSADAEELEGLQRGFPDCFSADPRDFRIPTSIIRARATIAWHEERGHESDVESSIALQPLLLIPHSELDLVPTFMWRDDQSSYNEPPIPEEVWEQLEERTLTADMQITYLGEPFIVTFWLDPYAENRLGERIDRHPVSSAMLDVVHARHIDLNH